MMVGRTAWMLIAAACFAGCASSGPVEEEEQELLGKPPTPQTDPFFYVARLPASARAESTGMIGEPADEARLKEPQPEEKPEEKPEKVSFDDKQQSAINDMLDQADRLECQSLFHYGAKDPFIPEEKIAEVEGGLQEETTYDGRKLRWSEDARKGLWTMKNAYQRRRVKARVEKREYRRTIFIASQAMGLYLLVGLFWLTARARILPRWSPYAAAGVWLVSLVRFI